MSDDTLVSWKKCTQDDCGQGCGLGRVRVTFDEDRYLVAVWYRLYVHDEYSQHDNTGIKQSNVTSHVKQDVRCQGCM